MATQQVNGKGQISTPRHTKTHSPIFTRRRHGLRYYLENTSTLWRCAAKLIASFVIFAVLIVVM